MRYLNPLVWLRWFGEFVYFWALSIPWRDAPKALPIIFLMALLMVAAVISLTNAQGRGWRTGLLDSQFDEAWNSEDYETAELVLRRQLQTNPEDAQLVNYLAECRDRLGESDEALKLMRDLVRVKGHTNSARWILKTEYVGKQWADLNDDERDEFGSLLKLIHDEDPNDLGIKQLYADYLIASEKLRQAIPLLEKLAQIQPMRGLQAAAISRRLKDEATANRLAEATLTEVARMSQEDPTNSVLALAVAQNQLFLRRYSEAVRTLDKAVQVAKTSQDRLSLKQAIGDAIVAWIQFIEESPSQTRVERLRVLKMLQNALQYAPNNPRVLTLVADQVLATLDNKDDEIEILREALISGSSPGIAHFIEGTGALMKDNVDKAMRHLKIASELMPRSGAILNNLAVAMTNRPGGDLEQALKISETAIQQTPNATAHFYETRGQILFRLKRYLKAIPDLERGLDIPELAVNAHEVLSQCYREIGEQELAKQHMIAAKKLEEREAVDNP